MFINSFTDKNPVKQQSDIDSRQQNSFTYYLKPGDNQTRIKVCKGMFLRTLAEGEWKVHKCVSKFTGNSTNVAKENVRSRLDKANDQRLLLKEFLDSLPKLESHYCRESTT